MTVPIEPVSCSQLPTPVLRLSELARKQGENCVHCGLCLPVCPTYLETGLETDSPRGRIHLMNALASGRIEPTDAVRRHLDLCLDCRACETACPSAVSYHHLIEETRAGLPAAPRRSGLHRVLDFLCREILPDTRRLALSMLPARLLHTMGLGSPLARLLEKLRLSAPARLLRLSGASGRWWPENLNGLWPASGTRHKRVGLLVGCAAPLMMPQTLKRAIAVLQHLGCEVVVPESAGCCGAMAHHNGDHAGAIELAKKNLNGLDDLDLLISPVAGCGAMLKEYDLLFAGSPLQEQAENTARRTRDLHECLIELNWPPLRHPVPVRAVYHEACHLIHAQRCSRPVHDLLKKIPGLELIPLAESSTCCGAAGSYNLYEPEMAARLAERKLLHIQSTGAGLCLLGNLGCQMHLAVETEKRRLPLSFLHPVDLLHRAMFGTDEPQNRRVHSQDFRHPAKDRRRVPCAP